MADSAKVDRREFIKAGSASVAGALLGRAVCGEDALAMGSGEHTRPNFLWLSAEDICPDVGCYGDGYADTPRIDNFAGGAVRYTNVFANAGVCAPARSCIITGMYPTTIGTHQMRCKGVPPPYVKCFSEYLRAAGYYCTNNEKTDYQFDPPASAWDECSKRAHWSGRAEGQPFFAVFNLEISHESQIREGEKWYKDRLEKINRHNPDKAALPPYYPDTPVVRTDWARYYDQVTLMDAEAGAILDKLEKDGLAEDTIVWFWGDNGRGLPRAKRWIYDSGIHVPLIVRVPEKWRRWAAGGRGLPKAGGVNDELVSFVDFAPTMLSLAGVEIPKHLQGQVVLGPQRAGPRAYIFAHRDRMDERYDIIRAVRDKRYKYIRNYMPHVTYAQYIEFMDQMPMLREMRRLNAEGKLAGPETLFFRNTKPIEELYDTLADPHEVNNLADDPGHRSILERMRGVHDDWMRQTADLGLIPEAEFDEMKRPGGRWEKTAGPIFAATADKPPKATIRCATPGASIIYKIGGEPSAGWQLYTRPIALGDKQRLTARCCRLGFRDSNEATFGLGDAAVTGAAAAATEPLWNERLASTDLLAKLQAIKRLDLRGAQAFADHLAALSDKEAAVRYWAVVGLQSTADQQRQTITTPVLTAMLEDPAPVVRIAVAETLCVWGANGDAQRVLSQLLRHPNDSTRLSATIAAEAVMARRGATIAGLQDALADEYNDVQKVARRAVGIQAGSG